jgi:putative colanic acid biosynthesis UDP-glucose lipid carrier transferase
LLAVHDTQPRVLRSQPGLAALIRAAIDPAVAVATLLVAALSLNGNFDGPYLVAALLVLSMTYRGSAPDTAGASVREIAGRWVPLVALLLLLGWASGTLDAFDPRVILAWVFGTPVAIYAAHRMVPRMLAAEGLQRSAVIAGANVLGRRLAERIRANPLLGVRFAGYFDDRGAARLAGIRRDEIAGTLEQLADYVKGQRIDLIYIALPMASQPRIARLIEALHDTTASVYLVPDIFAFDLIQARMDEVGGVPVLAVCESPFYGVNSLVKRASDILLASAILLLIAPLMLAIAAGVKLSSPGPVLFRQRRYGLDGCEIVVYKFRSMTCCEDDGNEIRQAQRDDARITPFGAFLRAYSLDELPQFINVLQGRMSVVGPRPHCIAHNELYRKLIRGYMIRHKVKPGITGLAQVNGLRGETATLDRMKARVEMDLAYLRNWSLWLDLKIVAKTVAVVLSRENAY